MAEDKKGFVLYADLLHTVNHLPDEIAGRLLKHILLYVNDKNPVSDELILNVTFEPIRQQLKRDLNKWESIREKRSEAGKASAKIRKQKEQMPTHAESVKQSITNPTVRVKDNVTVNVNDTVKVNDNNIETNVSCLPETDKPQIVIVPYKKIQDYFNEKCTQLSVCTTLTNKRKQTINARFKEHGLDAIKDVIDKASESKFLNGENDRSWKADFDWIFKPTNFIKILEGNYGDKKSKYSYY